MHGEGVFVCCLLPRKSKPETTSSELPSRYKPWVSLPSPDSLPDDDVRDRSISVEADDLELRYKRSARRRGGLEASIGAVSVTDLARGTAFPRIAAPGMNQLFVLFAPCFYLVVGDFCSWPCDLPPVFARAAGGLDDGCRGGCGLWLRGWQLS